MKYPYTLLFVLLSRRKYALCASSWNMRFALRQAGHQKSVWLDLSGEMHCQVPAEDTMTTLSPGIARDQGQRSHFCKSPVGTHVFMYNQRPL